VLLAQGSATFEKYRKKSRGIFVCGAFALSKGEAALGPTFEKYRRKSRGIFVCRVFALSKGEAP
jgi:hypothetical protein